MSESACFSPRCGPSFAVESVPNTSLCHQRSGLLNQWPSRPVLRTRSSLGSMRYRRYSAASSFSASSSKVSTITLMYNVNRCP
ncbi:Uncharacterised protein [Mycobacteroides abscessus subsp. abscessus]|nr:Uncharacterised protein [Mycobacteroides abscessus subsp. abscessus]